MWTPSANTGCGMSAGQRTPSGSGMCGPASMCQFWPPWLPGWPAGLRQAVLAITWQSSPSSGSITDSRRGCATARGAAVQHGVAEHLRVLRRPLAALVRRVALEDLGDLVVQLGDLGRREQAAD